MELYKEINIILANQLSDLYICTVTGSQSNRTV